MTQAEAFPPGHYYSPIPAHTDIVADQKRIFTNHPTPYIKLNEAEQFALLTQFKELYGTLPYSVPHNPAHRYNIQNNSYPNTDGTILHFMLRHLQPKRIIEVGSGHSSMVMLDANEMFFDGNMDLTFIEPYPQLFNSLLKPSDKPRLIAQKVQDVDISLFAQLEAGDMLFIDSSHVVKVGSDVNHLLFNVLPTLKPGVIIHFHDIFYGWEYPQAWVMGSHWYWTEMYLVKAFLAFNPAFQIVYFNHYMTHTHKAFFNEHMPLCVAPFCITGTGASLYIKKVL